MDERQAIKEAFTKVKEDISKSNEKLDSFQSAMDSLKLRMAELDLGLKGAQLRIAKEQEAFLAGLRASMQSLVEDVKAQLIVSQALNVQSQPLSQQPIQVQSQPLPSPDMRLKAEYYKKIDKNRKKIIKTKIIETLKAKDLTLPELKAQIVDIEQFCSKASFYRYYNELRELIQNPETVTKEPIKLKSELLSNSVS
ncbi:hypothetical protein JW968_04990 [Candidatus Woesearchaeota archaeon]|nr:hypothetical protein [Candidatus Woesearchaeota archaeon]